MNYKSIKLASEAPFPIEIVKQDATIKAVVIGDLRIEGPYGLSVMIAQPFEEVARHKVTATIEGFGTKVLHFADRYSGGEEVAALEASGAIITREDVKVMVNDRGEIVEQVSAVALDNDGGIPF